MKKPHLASPRNLYIIATATTALTVSLVTATMFVLFADNQGKIEQILDPIASAPIYLIMTLLLSVVVYFWLRKRHVGAKSEVYTTLIVTGGFLIAQLIQDFLLAPWLLDRVTPLGMALILGVISAVPTFLVSFVASILARAVYQHRNSVVM